ncbi:MAG: FliM/FliN family flagellar motor switch protein [Acidobacteriaceae bacterium]
MKEGARSWLGKLEAEIARELGQPVSLAAQGDAPEASRSLVDRIEVPGARLTLAVDSEDAAGFLAEARVIEAGQADAEMVRELWSGIVASVAARLGGKAGPAAPAAEPAGDPCALRLGNAVLRMALDVEAAESEGEAPVRDAAGSTGGRPVGNFDLLLEVELDASVRFGSRELELKDLLELGPGDVVELDRNVADPVDLIVGDRIVARGEVVLVNGNFGLRVTEVAEPVRRLESIRCIA